MNTPASARMPVIFFGHGSPMNTLARNRYTEAWRKLGAAVPARKSILALAGEHLRRDGAIMRSRGGRAIFCSRPFRRNLARVSSIVQSTWECGMRVWAAIGFALAFSAAPVWAGDLEDGLKFYKAGDYENAIASWQKAAALGNASAQFTLGFMHEKGQGTAVNFRQAADWYRQAAERGNAPAQTNLGFLYERGQGVAQDNRQAVHWYRRAADQGMAEAQFNLGRMYQTGQGVAQDYAQAASWFRKAGEQGHIGAQSSLGLMYETGQGVARDYKQAVYWYRKAAEKGDSRAPFDLGRIYEAGREGVAMDYVEAHKWWNIAEANGEERARNSRILVERLMTPEQIAAAQRLAGVWMKAHENK
jgi:TPR repeat protein